MTDINGKIAFVSGGASGIGLAMVQAFAKRGARVAIADIDFDLARRQAALIDGAAAIELDVTSEDSWRMAAETTRRALGPVSILCNNAGVGGGSGKLEEYDPEIWRWVYSVNVHALLYSARTFVPDMKASGTRCHIVNTASMVALVPTPNSIAYVASKFATLGISFGMRNEFEGFDIGVSVLCPGMTATRIVQTTGRLRPDNRNNALTDERMKTMHDILQTGMRPESVGEMVARAVEGDEFYILPSPEWKPMVEGHFSDILSGFREPAQPGHSDDLTSFLKAWNKTEMFGYRIPDAP